MVAPSTCDLVPDRSRPGYRAARFGCGKAGDDLVAARIVAGLSAMAGILRPPQADGAVVSVSYHLQAHWVFEPGDR